MSRSKDKHEGAGGRTYHIMSEAERASGRRGGWTALEVTGGVRALAPQLFQLTHLTALYLNDNSLQRIPPDINLLVNLHTLDLSNNKLRSLPAELGDLIQLRELLLHNNYLRVLPYELGKLFHLQMMGLHGNPLSKEMLSIYNDTNGTAKLLTYMLDNLQGVDPTQIQWLDYGSVEKIRLRDQRNFVRINEIVINQSEYPRSNAAGVAHECASVPEALATSLRERQHGVMSIEVRQNSTEYTQASIRDQASARYANARTPMVVTGLLKLKKRVIVNVNAGVVI
ncbi:CCR4-NOT transcription complex subunit 6-like [Eumeta japonica]|uniref:CCR4-NOT transcription complex subunit 6-like n=1 Tax=Eumeta variegata TaxID=151549 RepID=A0A4C1TML0_EUMVA|nr:CCR4-NOT transcription complex subunit 6-like [Eumeta japonica]